MNKVQKSILVLTCQNPLTPNNGAALRVAQNVFSLSRNYSVDVLVLGEKEESIELPNKGSIREINLNNSKVDKSIFSRLIGKILRLVTMTPYLVDRYNCRIVSKIIRYEHSQRRYSCAIIEEVALASYIKTFGELKLPFIYDAHNVEFVLRKELDQSETFLTRLENSGFKAIENKLVDNSSTVWTCSANDRSKFLAEFGNENDICVVPNSVNTPEYRRHIDDSYNWSSKIPTIVYLGTYKYFPNEEAALSLINDIFPIVQLKLPNAKLLIVGRHPTEKMRSAAAENKDIEITGTVKDIHDFLEIPSVFVLPIKLGGGTRLKILEAFASGRPVVSSSKACEGIDCIDGKHLLIAKEPQEFAELVISIWYDSERLQKLCKEALQLVEESYSWDYASRCMEPSIDKL